MDRQHRETMSGDWFASRTRWKEHGIEMQFILAGFVQGTASGGVQRQTVFNGKFESKFNIDFEKLSGWKYWSAQAKFEYRFGAPVLAGTGAINTVNTNVTVPASQGSVFAITALNFTRSSLSLLRKAMRLRSPLAAITSWTSRKNFSAARASRNFSTQRKSDP